MEDLSRIDFTWGRSKKKLNLKREQVPMENSPSFNIPDELTLHIISFLNVFDVLSLGSCSKFLNQLCESDRVWKNLYGNRWPNHLEAQNGQGWKNSYMNKHKEMVAIFLDRFSGSFEELHPFRYFKAFDILCDLEVGFEDVCLLFHTKLSVMLNLIALHYACFFLTVSREDLIGALVRHGVWHREVVVHWCISDVINSWLSGSEAAESYALTLSLAEIANGETDIFCLLHHGNSDEVKGLTIRPAKSYVL